MTIVTSTTLAALITSNNCVSPAGAPVMVGISHHESGLNALAIHDNITERRYEPTNAAEAVRADASLLGLGYSVDTEVVEVMLNPDGNLWEDRLGPGMRQIGTMQATGVEPFISMVASTLRASVTRKAPILESELPIRCLGSFVDEEARARLVELRDATAAALVAYEAAAECVLRAMEDEDDPPLLDCVAAAWDGAGG
jgi:hypothetical protein